MQPAKIRSQNQSISLCCASKLCSLLTISVIIMPQFRHPSTLLRLVAFLALGSQAAFVPCSQAGWLGIDAVSGSGHIVSQTRAVPAFSKIQLEGAVDVEVTVGQPQAVTVRIDDNLQDHLRTEVHGDTLVIGETGNVSGHHRSGSGPMVTIQMPAISTVALSGSGDIDLLGLSEKSLALSIAGSGDISASGQVDTLDVSIAGSGDARLGKLQAHAAKVDVAGSGDVDVDVTTALEAVVDGSGDIVYHGSPQVTRRVNGSGDVRQK
jgi:hypothetical protein